MQTPQTPIATRLALGSLALAIVVLALKGVAAQILAAAQAIQVYGGRPPF